MSTISREDQYCGARLVCVAALRLISKRLPDQFPFQTNWRTDACHFAFWELVPTLDHILPVSRGGTDDESNWATTSMLRNFGEGQLYARRVGLVALPIRRHEGLGWPVGLVH